NGVTGAGDDQGLGLDVAVGRDGDAQPRSQRNGCLDLGAQVASGQQGTATAHGEAHDAQLGRVDLVADGRAEAAVFRFQLVDTAFVGAFPAWRQAEVVGRGDGDDDETMAAQVVSQPV